MYETRHDDCFALGSWWTTRTMHRFLKNLKLSILKHSKKEERAVKLLCKKCGWNWLFAHFILKIIRFSGFFPFNADKPDTPIIKRHFQQYFSYIVAVSFIGGGNQSTRRNHRPVGSHWQTLSYNIVSSTPRHERASNSQR